MDRRFQAITAGLEYKRWIGTRFFVVKTFIQGMLIYRIIYRIDFENVHLNFKNMTQKQINRLCSGITSITIRHTNN